MSDKHTPVPWAKDFGGTLGHIKSIADCGTIGGGVRKTPTVAKYYVDEQILPHDEQEANARFIVKACNHHAELVEALRQARQVWDHYLTTGGGSPVAHGQFVRSAKQFMDSSETLLAKLDADQT